MPVNDNLDALVDEFDAVWHAGGSPGIGEFLIRFTGQNQEQLLEQLLPIDIEYQLKSGNEVSAESYNQFGERAVAIAADAIEQSGQHLESLIGGPNETVPPQQYPENADGYEPQQIDQYHLLKKIGEGGMGSVWLAEQREPVVRLSLIHI